MWLQLLIGIGLMILGYLIMPKPKAQRPQEATEMEGPTAEAGRAIIVMWGEITIKSPNFLWWGDKYYTKRSKKTGKK